jgi:hypothetical protein
VRNWLAGLKRWWLRRFRGYVAAPARSGGTSWQQHPRSEHYFICGNRPKDQTLACTEGLQFTKADYMIRSQDHVEGCQFPRVYGIPACDCPVTDARYVKICPCCGLGHWRQA